MPCSSSNFVGIIEQSLPVVKVAMLYPEDIVIW